MHNNTQKVDNQLENIGKIISEARIKKQYTQERTAELLKENGIEISQRSYSNLESGKTKKPDIKLVAILGRILDIDGLLWEYYPDFKGGEIPPLKSGVVDNQSFVPLPQENGNSPQNQTINDLGDEPAVKKDIDSPTQNDYDDIMRNPLYGAIADLATANRELSTAKRIDSETMSESIKEILNFIREQRTAGAETAKKVSGL